MKTPLFAALIGILLTPSLAGCQETAPRFEKRWVWVMCNLQVEKEADRVVGLVEQAARSGYNALVISDYKLNILGRVPAHYFKNAERVKAAARKHQIELIPALFPIGYANGLLAHDPNLAEGMPVVDAPFRVEKGEARLVASSSPLLKNGTMEETLGDRFLGYGNQDETGKCTVVDRSIRHDGVASIRMQRLSETQNCRLIQTVKLKRNACYRLSAWVKTKDLAPVGGFNLMAIGKNGRRLTFYEGGLEPTQDWKQIEVVFNTVENEEVNVYVGIWGGQSGTLWVDGLALEQLGLTNVLRRGGCPIQVKSADGATLYSENDDFHPIVDPLLGNDPYAGEYEFRHPAPSIRLTEKSRIKEGERLLVSWYHPVLIHGNVVMCCLSDSKVYALLEDQAKRVNELFQPSTVFFQHDEMRIANWCRDCRLRKLSPGELLAQNVKSCTQIMKRVNPKARVAIWSDMFDPEHNAIDGYYLVNGSLAGSWEGLDPSLIIANWNGGKASKSLSFFAQRGHEQVIAGYYDNDDNLATWLKAAKGVPKVNGFMYTTWVQKYVDLERYGKAIAPRK